MQAQRSVNCIVRRTVYSEAFGLQILEIIDVEENQLLNLLKETEGTSEKCFVEYTLELLKKRKNELFLVRI